MLPLISQVCPAITGLSIIVSQVAMVFSAHYSAQLLPTVGSRKLLIVCFAAIPVRGLLIVIFLSTLSTDSPFLPPLLLTTQILDGLSGGIFGVIAILCASSFTRSELCIGVLFHVE